MERNNKALQGTRTENNNLKQFKSVDYLDITLNMTNGLFQPYRKPNDEPLYINAKSNHPLTVIEQIPAAINHRLSALSSNKETFDKAKPLYDKALRRSGFDDSLHYCKKNTTTPTKRNRKRNIIWFNPPYSKNVQTNVAKTFLKLIKKQFPPNHNLHPVFHKNNVKVSYSCMPNMGSIINNHNKKILTNNNTTPQNGCNCRKKDQCPLDNNCLITSVIYKANVTTDKDDTGKNYLGSGLTEGTFKQRYTQHKLPFRNRKYAYRTELAKHNWKLKENNENHKIN